MGFLTSSKKPIKQGVLDTIKKLKNPLQNKGFLTSSKARTRMAQTILFHFSLEGDLAYIYIRLLKKKWANSSGQNTVFAKKTLKIIEVLAEFWV